MTSEQTRSILREELEKYFSENPITVRQLPYEPEIVDLERLVELRPIVGTKSTIYKKVSAGTIPHSKRGKKLYFQLSEIDEWLVAGKVKTVAEMEQETTDFLTRKYGR